VSEIAFTVSGYPPTKNEAKSPLSEWHPHAARVRALLEAAQQALAGGAQPIEHGERGDRGGLPDHDGADLHRPLRRPPGYADFVAGGVVGGGDRGGRVGIIRAAR
jgi:hypothetical protein